MTMTRLPMGCNGGMVGVAAPLRGYPKQDADQATYLGGSAKATVALPPAVDAAAYTPAATLTTSANDVEDGHHILPSEDELGMGNVAALSAQENWSASRMNPFGKLWDMLSPMRSWLADLVSVKSMESGLLLAGAQAHDLSVPVAMQVASTDLTLGQPAQPTSKPSKGPSSSQGDGQNSTPSPKETGQSVPRWKLILAMTPGRR